MLIDTYFHLGEIQCSIFNKIQSVLKKGTPLNDIKLLVEKEFLLNSLEVIAESYPVTLNLNSTVYHGRELSNVLASGDLLTVDICFKKNGLVIDGAKTFLIDSDDTLKREIVEVSREGLVKLTSYIEEGMTLSDIISFLDSYYSLRGYYLFPHGMGHGLGDPLHKRPFISLSYPEDFGYKIKKNEPLAIEPLIFKFKEDVKEDSSGAGYISALNFSSQFEVTLILDENGKVRVVNRGLLK